MKKAKTMQSIKVEKITTDIVEKYWSNYSKYEKEQYAFRFSSIAKIVEENFISLENKKTIDIGGGWGLFSAICSSMSMKSWLYDDFRDEGFLKSTDIRKSLPNDFNFSVKQIDISKQSLNIKKDSFDLITTFDVIEHLHNSPKKMIHEAYDALKKGGVLIIGVPNCVRLTKRISYLLGNAKWSNFNDYYHSNVFRGHVREYDIDDLTQVARDLSSTNYKIIGRHFYGFESPKAIVRVISKTLYFILRPFPKLCDSLFLIIKK